VCVYHKTLSISLGEQNAGFEPAVPHQWHHNNRGKWGGVTPPHQPPTSRLHVPRIFPQLEADAADAPQACRAAQCQTRLFCGSTAAGGALLNAPTDSPQQASQTRRREAMNIYSTPIKEGGRERKNMAEKRDDEEHLFFLYYRRGAAGKITTRDKRPKTMISPPWPRSLVAHNLHSILHVCFLHGRGQLNYIRVILR